MASQADVRRIALSLPATEEVPDRFARSGEVLHRAALQRVPCRSSPPTRRDRPRAQADHRGGVALPSPEGLGREGKGTSSSKGGARTALVRLSESVRTSHCDLPQLGRRRSVVLSYQCVVLPHTIP
jgi:hypothetical protein